MPLTPHILESALLLVATFLVGCVIGYALRKAFAKPAPVSAGAAVPDGTVQPKPVTKSRRSTGKVAAPAPEDTAPLQSDSAEGQSIDADVVSDDLKKINGIGPKLEKELKAAGVLTYAQIAGWSAHTIEEMDTKLGARGRIKRQDWVRQAKALAKPG